MLKFKLGLSDFETVTVPDMEAALRLMERERFGLYVPSTEGYGASKGSRCANVFGPPTRARP